MKLKNLLPRVTYNLAKLVGVAFDNLIKRVKDLLYLLSIPLLLYLSPKNLSQIILTFFQIYWLI